MTKQKLKLGFYGISGCAGCLLSVLFEDCFKQLVELVDIKAFPLIKEDSYKGELDYIFVEGTVCFDEDIIALNELRKKTKYIIALGACSCVGGVPSIKNFLDSEKTMKLVYPVYNYLKSTLPTPIDMHIKVDYYIPQCPPNKEEIIEFVKCIATNREFKPCREPVCFECRRKSNPCILDKGEICLGPITNGGCGALCPSNNTECYGCRGPSKDANLKAYADMLKQMGYTKENMHDKMKTFAGLQFKEQEGNQSDWLEK
jgi:coenzyme F420-reducing hydrogenase gamma subunit